MACISYTTAVTVHLIVQDGVEVETLTPDASCAAGVWEQAVSGQDLTFTMTQDNMTAHVHVPHDAIHYVERTVTTTTEDCPTDTWCGGES